MQIHQALNGIKTIQGALRILSLLQLTSYRFPQQATVKDGDTFDFIVVGAGTAGCVLANRLTEDPNVRVLLVEAGGDPPVESMLPGLFVYLSHSQVDWNYTTVNDGYSTQYHKNKVYKATQGKMLGGSSSLNYMLYLRGAPEDYDSWAKVAKDDSWSYKNILPYFIKSERLEDQEILQSKTRIFHGKNGYMGVTRQTRPEMAPFLQAFQEMGYEIVLDLNGNQTLGYGDTTYTVSGGDRQSTAQSFLSPIRNRQNLFVLKHSLVTKILFDKNKKAIGVKIIDENNNCLKVMAKLEVIVSAGAINSPQLLMLSGVGPKKHLQSLKIPILSDLPVGQNLQDHYTVLLFYVMNEVANTSAPLNPHSVATALISGFVSLSKNQSRDYESNTVLGNADLALQVCTFLFAYSDDICKKINDSGKGKQILITLLHNIIPKSRGQVLLQSSDPKQAPVIDLRAFADPDDLSHMVNIIRDYTRIETSTLFKNTGPKLIKQDCVKGLKVGSDEYWRKYILCMSTTGLHYAGTCPMGSVVDSRLRVLKVGRLRVVDASVMPTISSANPSPSIVMIAEKAADMIKQDNGLKL